MKDRPYQVDAIEGIKEQWKTVDNTLLVIPTGGGKTYIMSRIMKEHTGAACAIAHRKELVGQIAMAFAMQKIPHRVIGPASTVRGIVKAQMQALGTSYYDPQAKVAVAGVDTLINRGEELRNWLPSVTLWVQDEAHHVLKSNKWGKAAAMFPNAKGLGVTATPLRADGRGLGSHSDGVFDSFVIGPSARDLINDGYLTDYRIFCPPNDLDLSNVKVSSSTGDYNQKGVNQAVQRSKIMGNIVDHYAKISSGAHDSGITFVPSVEIAIEESKEFNDRGIQCEVVSAKTPTTERDSVIRRFKELGGLIQLINVDLFGEGFDLPALSTVSFARPTMSYSLYAQQFGRALRPVYAPGYPLDTAAQRLLAIKMGPKPVAKIIDHVGNVVLHRLPDAPREWSLNAREKRGKSKAGEIPLKVCVECTSPYEAVHRQCPYCGKIPVPLERTGPEFVDGDLAELTPDVLAAMRGEVAKIDMDKEDFRAQMVANNVPLIGQLSGVNRHVAKQDAQNVLRTTIAQWAGVQKAQGKSDSESYRRFYFNYGIDVLSAQALGTKEASELNLKIVDALGI